MSTSHWFASFVGGAVMVAAVTTDAGAQQQQQDRSNPVAAAFRLDGAVFADSHGTNGANAGHFRLANLEMGSFDQSTDEGVAGSRDIVWDVDDFFNVRQANSDVERSEWELELGTRWFTGNTGGDDDFFFVGELAYGLTEDAFVELRLLPVNIGDGGDLANGDIEIELFNRFVQETDSMPAIALSLEGRFPTGDGSSGVDGELGLHVTRTIAAKTRMHLQGTVETANGGRTEEEEGEGRHFQWSAGIGFDYEFSDDLLCVVNYVNQASEEFGGRNEQFLELGTNYKIAPGQGIKVAVDAGLTGVGEEPDFGVKIQYEIEFD